jgi:hypothetical protein
VLVFEDDLALGDEPIRKLIDLDVAIARDRRGVVVELGMQGR